MCACGDSGWRQVTLSEGGYVVAMPIKPTPVLSKREAVNFLQKVEGNLDKPSYRIATPKLSQAKELAKRHAVLQPK